MSLSQEMHSSPEEFHLLHPREREQQSTHRAYAFGQFRLFDGERPIKDSMWRRNKARVLLKWFILNPGKLCSADQFIDLFWPDLPIDAAMGNLHVTIHFLRHLLEPSLGSRHESKFIRRQTNNYYWFDMDETWWTDTSEVQHFFETAKTYDRSGDDTRASYYYRKVISYCSLGFLPEDDAEEWLQPYRQHYNYIYSQVLIRLIQIYQQHNELDEVLEYAYLALALDPYCEPAVKAIIDVKLKQGNIFGAKSKLEHFRNLLHHELGMEPSKEIRVLRKQIMLASE
jgi:DNA-binding SARP family transcriptional activator